MDCLFCKIVEGKEEAHKIYEDDRVLAFLDIYPAAKAHTLVIPKKHYVLIEDMSKEDVNALFSTVYKLTPIICKVVNSKASTIGINNGKDARQEIPHVHVHIIPRFGEDCGKKIQEVVGKKFDLRKNDLDKIAKKIKSLLNS